MGLLTKPNVKAAPAGAVVTFERDGSVGVAWHGDIGLLMRAPACYLDWALNKDRKRDAEAMLRFLSVSFSVIEPDDSAISFESLSSGFRPRDVEATIGMAPTMRVAVSFRPRTAIATHLYLTFGALWNGWMDVLEEEAARDAIDSLIDDMREQIDIHEQIGVGSRAGVASVQAARLGAGRRLEQEIAVFAGLTVEDFRALAESDRDVILARHARASVEAPSGP
jgi:hypothetical protein